MSKIDTKNIKGIITAIITPFKENKIDKKAYKNLIEMQVKAGINGVVPCGTTGESATLDFEEHEMMIDYTLEIVERRMLVIAGAGSNNTKEAIRLSRHAQKAGADAVLTITPYYNKPTQNGMYEHFRAIAEEVDIPVILYNVPGRTGVNMLPETVARLSEIKNIIGIKEATGSLQQVTEIMSLCKKGFIILSGDDFTALPSIAIGAKGVISVTSNIVPAKMVQMFKAYESGNMEEAVNINLELWQLHNAMFIESNPIPVKAAAHLMGWISNEIRLPLTPLSGANLNKLKSVMIAQGLING
ncbi:MAG: 4-hydroxy-tetrahydrodipicolinate synthase [bacterium]